MRRLSNAQYFQALANPHRLRIVKLLARRGTSNATQIAKGAGLEQSAASHYLKSLLAKKLVSVERKGKWRLYTLRATGASRPFLDLLGGFAGSAS